MEAFEVIIIGWVFLSSLFAVSIFAANVLRKRRSGETLIPSDCSVIIPFRNEELRLIGLLNSLKSQTILPKHVFFIDDHSTDNGRELIHAVLSESEVNYSIEPLPENEFGKKRAVFYGMQRAQTTYCLTLDADIILPQDYFIALPHSGDYSMICLPVFMFGEGVIGKLMELEYGSFQLLQGAVNENNPLMASGANLLVNRQDYLTFNNLAEHQHIASGDDQFALAQFKKRNLKVSYRLDRKCQVFTEVPSSIKELLRQRIRWMGNNTEGNDWRATFFAAWVLVVNVGFLGLCIFSIIQCDLLAAIQLFSFKFMLDVITYFSWFRRHQKWESVVLLPILQILYPMYLIIMGFSYLFQKRTWKERTVK
jgi:glycosyltransferase involved in cell wall biosynthesis